MITSKSKAGAINGEEIWKIDQLELLSYTRNDNHLNEQQVLLFPDLFIKTCKLVKYFLEKNQ